MVIPPMRRGDTIAQVYPSRAGEDRRMKRRVARALSRVPLLLAASRWLYRHGRRASGIARTIIYVSSRTLRAKATGADERWRRELPVQAVLRHQLDFECPAPDRGSLLTGVHELHRRVGEGRDSLYLPPEVWRRSRLAFLMNAYPPDCGLKINKNEGGAEARYMSPHPGRAVQRRLSASHREQLLVFNHLNVRGLAPRLYDLIELKDTRGRVWTAYVVQHLDGGVPGERDTTVLVEGLKRETASDALRLISNDGWSSRDFTPPDCKGNAVQSPALGRPLYVDVHNFKLGTYDRVLGSLAEEVRAASHFGEARGNVIGGDGRCLYQEIPGADPPAKRSPVARMRAFDALLREAVVKLEQKAVLDVGCNLGLMSAEYLRRGAMWVHGWDYPEVIEAAEKVLLAVGCTRFSLTPMILGSDSPPLSTVPPHILGQGADRIVISYLAVRKHVGWLRALDAIPWRHMLYEGHEGDGPLEEYVSALEAIVPVDVLARGTVSDAMSPPRSIALLRRLD